MNKILFCFTILLLLPLNALALNRIAHSWTNLDVQGALFNSDCLVFDLTPQARYDITNGIYIETRLEGSLGYKISKNVTLWLGDRYTLPHGDSSIRENGLVEYLTWNAINKKNIQLITRTRFEERKATQFSQIAYRFRQRELLVFPTLFTAKLGPVFYDELFLNLNRTNWTNNNLFNQNRAFAGLRYTFNKAVNLDVGYLNRYLLTRSTPQDDHILFVSLNINVQKDDREKFC